ncbi:hypothetical protein HanRHA438_Chr15g0708441 [Helianthus annuus]|nr:hypothetical protein HanRHA438_Chr15g0708441 [Helianthus annuus]
MDPKNNAPSFLKLIDDYDPIFLVCDGFTKFVKDSGLKKNDYLLVNAIGTSTFYVSVSKSCVFENSFISKVAPDDTFIFLADKFWKDFYGERFKGGEATLYVGNRYWNVKMEGWPDISAFTDGFSKLIDDISLDTRYTMLFTSVGYKTFESKHKEKHETNESHVEQDLSGDSVGDFQLSNFESIFNDTEDSKFDRHIAAQIEMEDAKNLFKDGWNTKNDALNQDQRSAYIS